MYFSWADYVQTATDITSSISVTASSNVLSKQFSMDILASNAGKMKSGMELIASADVMQERCGSTIIVFVPTTRNGMVSVALFVQAENLGVLSREPVHVLQALFGTDSHA